MDGWYRANGRAVVSEVAEEVGRAPMPYQLGIGVKSGCEIAARLAQVVYDADREMHGARWGRDVCDTDGHGKCLASTSRQGK